MRNDSDGAERRELDLAAELEAHGEVEVDGAAVGRAGVQERGLAARADPGGDAADEVGGEALAPVRRVGADGADLGPAGRVQALAGERDQAAVAVQAEVGPQLVRAGRNGPGSVLSTRSIASAASAAPTTKASSTGSVRRASVATSWTPATTPSGTHPPGASAVNPAGPERTATSPSAYRSRRSRQACGSADVATAAKGETSAG